MATAISTTQDTSGSLLRDFFNANGGYRNFYSYEIGAVTELAKNLMGINVWEKMVAIYPFIGRNATAHSFNIRNINNYRITWNGSVIHDKNGITGNGGWGATSIPLNVFANKTDNIHLSAYNKTNLASSMVDGRLIGANSQKLLPNLRDIGAQEINFNTSSGIVGYCYGEFRDLAGFGFANTDLTGVTGKGLLVANNSSKCYLNNARFGAEFSLPPDDIRTDCPRSIILLGNRYEGDVTAAARVNLAFASVGYGLTEQEIGNLTKCVERFQSVMFRSAL